MTMLPTMRDATLRLDGRVAILTLNRDDVRNELTGTALTDDIVSAADWVNRADDVSVLVLTGTGQAFSAGGNVKHMRDREGIFGGDVYAVQENYRRGIQRIALAMQSIEVPVIAAINGAAIGAGFDLTLMCDIRIAAETAKMGSTFLNLGIVPGDGGAWFLQRLIGPQRTAEMIFTGRVITARQAQELGIVLEVVDRDDLIANVLCLAQAIAAKPPQATRLAKRLLGAAARMELGDFLALCATFQGMCHNTADHGEAVAAFLEKRQAHYQGR
jgi:enoyl-CoA hydratase/carnithine racemase